MRYSVYILVLVGSLFFYGSIKAQTTSVSGIVVDAENKESLPGAHVFLASTTLGSTTDNEGLYTISHVPPGRYTVIVSMIGYETGRRQIQVMPGENAIRIEFELKRRLYELDGVEVTAERNRDWERLYQRFRKEFIGEGMHSEETVLLNPEVLELNMDIRGRLSAQALEPLQVENRSLGYRITYVLDYFVMNTHTDILQYRGEVFFEEIPPGSDEEKEILERRRKDTYKGSQAHLLASIVQGRTYEEGFRLYRSGGLISSRNLITSSISSTQKEITPLAPLQIIYLRDTKEGVRNSSFFKGNKVQEYTKLEFRADTVVVEIDGFYSPPSSLFFSYAMSERRVSDLLPRNYGLDEELLNREDYVPLGRHYDGLIAWSDSLLEGPQEPEGKKIMVVDDTLLLDTRVALAKEAIASGKWQKSGRLLRDVLKDDDQNMAAHYWLAIQYREKAKAAGYVDPEYLPGQAKKIDSDWERAIGEFEWIISRDSSYADVLLQYALLWRYAPRYPRSLALVERQVELRPDLDHVYWGLFEIYQAYVHHLDNKRALKKLKDRHSLYATYAHADVLRRLGSLDEAEEELLAIINQEQDMPLHPVYLSLARVQYQRSNPEEAERYVMQAIDEIDSISDALLVFEDIKYILTPEELSDWNGCTNAKAYQQFMHSFWQKRDPVPADPINQRMTEHYRRLIEAETHFVYPGVYTVHTNPDPLFELPIPESVKLNQEFNDKGLIFIRHGEPDEKVSTLGENQVLKVVRSPARVIFRGEGGAVEGGLSFDQSGTFDTQASFIPFNESWRYTNPRMDFHFALSGGGANWRLRQGMITASEDIVVNLEGWGGIYTELSNCVYKLYSPFPCTAAEVVSLEEEHKKDSREAVEVGLRTDRHTWDETIEHLEVPFFTSTFRDAEGETAVEIYYALPTDVFARRAGDSSEYEVELGCAIHDADWQLLDKGFARQRVEKDIVKQEPMIGSCRFVAFPNVYHLSLHSRLLTSNLIGAYKFDANLPDYNVENLSMSGLVPALTISPASRQSRFNKGDLYVKPNPLLQYSINQPLHLYYEVYNLNLDESGQSSYRVSYTFTQLKKGLFNRGERDEVALSVTTTQSADGALSVLSPEFDVSNLAPAEYVLRVEVLDEVSGERVERSIELELTK